MIFNSQISIIDLSENQAQEEGATNLNSSRVIEKGGTQLHHDPSIVGSGDVHGLTLHNNFVQDEHEGRSFDKNLAPPPT